MHIALDGTLQFVLSHFQIIGSLRVEPKPSTRIEVTSESQLALCYALESPKSFDPLPRMKLSCLFRPEGLNHTSKL